ncbi:MAG: hypothetical protein Q8R44_05045 [Novosphingobium sp.]|nr:hypothetical protein [Novosphingobium sp.]
MPKADQQPVGIGVREPRRGDRMEAFIIDGPGGRRLKGRARRPGSSPASPIRYGNDLPLKRSPMRRAPGEHLCQRDEIECIASLERGLADAVLLCVVVAAQADGPAIGWLERATAIGARADVRALNWHCHVIRR